MLDLFILYDILQVRTELAAQIHNEGYELPTKKNRADARIKNNRV